MDAELMLTFHRAQSLPSILLVRDGKVQFACPDRRRGWLQRKRFDGHPKDEREIELTQHAQGYVGIPLIEEITP